MAAAAAVAVRYDFERGLVSVLDLVAIVEANPQRRARLIDKLARKRAAVKAQRLRFDDEGRMAYGVSLDAAGWIAAELGNPEAMTRVLEDLAAEAHAWKLRREKHEARRYAKPTEIRYDVQRGVGSVYDVVAMCRSLPVVQRAVIAPLLEKYGVRDTLQFPGKGQRPTPVAPYETLRRIACDHQSHEACAALTMAVARDGAQDGGGGGLDIRFDPVTKLGAVYDVCAQCDRPKSALSGFAPAACVFAVFPGKGQVQVPAAPPDVLAAAAFYLGRPDVAAAILRHLPGRSACAQTAAATAATTMAELRPPAKCTKWVTLDMLMAKYGEYVRLSAVRLSAVREAAQPRRRQALLSGSDWQHLLGPGVADAADAPTVPAAPRQRLDVRYKFSDVWVHKLFMRFRSLLPEDAEWYYWPAAEETTAWALLEHAAVGVLVDELVARGTVALRGSVSLWKLVDAAGALGRAEGRRLAHTAASHLAYDTVQAKCRSEFGPWPTWRGAGGTRFDFRANKPLRGLACGNSAAPAAPRFLEAWPDVRVELCAFSDSPSSGKETFFVVRGMSLLGDDQKDIEGCFCVCV